jgi:hypothetical protein
VVWKLDFQIRFLFSLSLSYSSRLFVSTCGQQPGRRFRGRFGAILRIRWDLGSARFVGE